MNKINLHNQPFTPPNDHTILCHVGNYTFSSFDSRIYITGIYTICLSDLPRTDLIHSATLGKELSEDMNKHFNLDHDKVYFCTSMAFKEGASYSYIFNCIADSLTMLDLIHSFKLIGIDDTLLKRHMS